MKVNIKFYANGIDTNDYITISEGNRKMGLLPSFSTTPGICGSCPINCNGCYAMKMERIYPSVKKSYANNFKNACENMYGTFDAINRYLAMYRPTLFRWHVSGDIINSEYFTRMVDTANRNTETQFFAFTKCYAIVNKWIDENGKLPQNLRIIFSGWPNLPMKNPHRMPEAWMQDGTEDRVPTDAESCPGDCNTCQKCAWIENGKSVVFMKH